MICDYVGRHAVRLATAPADLPGGGFAREDRIAATIFYDATVLLYFDESGDFGFPAGQFDCYVQGALICPESHLPVIERFVAERQAEWGVAELHAAELTPDQLVQICRFIEESDCQLLNSVTDTVVTTAAGIGEFRLAQSATLRKNLDWYKARGGNVQEIEEWMQRNIKRTRLASRMSDSEYVQAHLMVELIVEAFQKALIFFHEDNWREDFHEFRFILDGKLPAKMAAGEKYMHAVIVPTLGSRPGKSIITVETWRQDPPHPFHVKYSVERGRIAGQDVEGGLDLNLIFEHGLQFEPSHEHAGLQLVDAASYTIRRAVMDPENRAIQRAYDALRPKMRNDDGKSLRLVSLNVGEQDRSSLERYRPLYDKTRV